MDPDSHGLQLTRSQLKQLNEKVLHHMDMGTLIKQLSIEKQHAFVWLFINNQAEAFLAQTADENGRPRGELPLGEPKSNHKFPMLLRQLNKIPAFREVATVAILADELRVFKQCFTIKDQEELQRQRSLARRFVDGLRLLKDAELDRLRTAIDEVYEVDAGKRGRESDGTRTCSTSLLRNIRRK